MLQEAYLDLAKKSLAFFSAVTRLFDADYIIKVDDDVYFRLPHTPHIVRQWKELGAGADSDSVADFASAAIALMERQALQQVAVVSAGYIGCMKTGGEL